MDKLIIPKTMFLKRGICPRLLVNSCQTLLRSPTATSSATVPVTSPCVPGRLSTLAKATPTFDRTDGCTQCNINRSASLHTVGSQQLRKEVQAVTQMFIRSRIFPTTDFLKELCSPASVRWFSSSVGKQQQHRGPQQSSGDGKEGDKDPDEDRMPFVARMMLVFWLSFLTYIVVRLQSNEDSGVYRFVSWNEFLHDMLAKGEVEELVVRPEGEMAFIRLYRGAIIRNKKVDSEIFTMKIPNADKFEDKVRKAEAELGLRPEQGVSISYQRDSSLASLVFMAIVGLALFFVFRNMVKIQLPNASDMFASERKAKFVRADLMPNQGHSISFKDVAGLHEAKVEVLEFVDYLKRPEKYKELGARIPHGALLLGPPGCGKTLLAKALATEAQVPFLAMAGSEFVEMVGGLGAARVRDLFKEAREKAPCIIYIDEIDAIGRRRSGKGGSGGMEGSSEEEHTLNQLLVEMDGMDTVEGVIMIASTNRSDVLDKALLRPGRFDRHIMIDYPTLAERKETFEMYLGKMTTVQPPRAYSERLAQLSPGMSGADIANICNEAALHAARDLKKAIDTEDFEYAVERVVAGVAKKSRVLSEVEKRVVAYHEAGHALVGWMLEHTDALLKVSIVPRTNKALGFAQYMPSDQKLFSEQQIFERMCMALGGRVAESITFNRITSGAQDDLRKVTDMAYKQVRELGMNDTVGHLSFVQGEGAEFAAKPYSKALAALIDTEAKQLVAKAYQNTEKLMKVHKEKLRMVAEALLEKESLSYTDMEELIGPPPYGRKSFITDPVEQNPA